ncbi:MAG: bifunctional UDP-N-acetylglucosamine diphosphorylase/glucosamine-1-phosphate N-acetyltransferase GlmU [Dethiobacteria bacterium]
MSSMAAIILAAGEVTRSHSLRPRLGQMICGKPMVEHVTDNANLLTDNLIVVVDPGNDEVQKVLGAERARYICRERQRGTGEAMKAALASLPDSGSALILHGDMPLLLPRTLEKIAQVARERAAVILTARAPYPSGRGRIIRKGKEDIGAIVEEREATEEEKAIEEIDTGVYCFVIGMLKKYLPLIRPRKTAGAYFFADIISLMVKDGLEVGAVMTEDYKEGLKIKDFLQLAEAAKVMCRRINRKLMEAGVNIIDPDSVFIDAGVEVGCDTVIYPQTIIEGRSRIGKGCRIGPGTHLRDVSIDDRCTVRNSVAEESVIQKGANIGPFAYLRPGTVIGEGVKIGNFVEVKNSDVGAGSKIPHLSYIGDADIGTGVNFGAGSIIVNYDGQIKHRTSVQKDSFIGCNSNLIAPIRIGTGAYVAAGSTLNKDVPAGALALGRAYQVNKPGMAKRFLKEK